MCRLCTVHTGVPIAVREQHDTFNESGECGLHIINIQLDYTTYSFSETSPTVTIRDVTSPTYFSRPVWDRDGDGAK